MEQTHDNAWERSLEQLARRFDYPPTPDMAAAVRRQTVRLSSPDDRPGQAVARPSAVVSARLAWAALVVALLIIGLMAVPQTRAALLSLFARIGAIDVFIDDTQEGEAPTPTAVPTGPPPASPAAAVHPTAAPRDTVAHSLALFELGEPVTLDEARQLATFELLAPAALGEPDEVYVHHNVDLPAVTLVWRDADGAPLTLTEIGVAEFANKLVHETNARAARVNGRPAVWLEGPHMLELLGNWETNRLLIDSNVLLWAAGDVTYRLEGDLREAEMIAIGESLPLAESDE
jgi:hypothetical protein